MIHSPSQPMYTLLIFTRGLLQGPRLQITGGREWKRRSAPAECLDGAAGAGTFGKA